MDTRTHLICRLVIVALASLALAANLSPVTNWVMAALIAVNVVASAFYWRRLTSSAGSRSDRVGFELTHPGA
jgi:membrane protein implicated in regulation of membrane protease activity